MIVARHSAELPTCASNGGVGKLPSCFLRRTAPRHSCDVVAVADNTCDQRRLSRHSLHLSLVDANQSRTTAASSLLVDLLELHYATISGGLTWLALIGLTTYRY